MKALFDSKTKHDGTNLLPTSPKPREVARAMLRPERTLTARVAELERVQAEHDRRIAALERKVEP